MSTVTKSPARDEPATSARHRRRCLGYYVVLAQDCVASDDQALHDAAMLLMRHRFDLARSDEIVATWAESARLPAAFLAGDRLIG